MSQPDHTVESQIQRLEEGLKTFDQNWNGEQRKPLDAIPGLVTFVDWSKKPTIQRLFAKVSDDIRQDPALAEDMAKGLVNRFDEAGKEGSYFEQKATLATADLIGISLHPSFSQIFTNLRQEFDAPRLEGDHAIPDFMSRHPVFPPDKGFLEIGMEPTPDLAREFWAQFPVVYYQGIDFKVTAVETLSNRNSTAEMLEGQNLPISILNAPEGIDKNSMKAEDSIGIVVSEDGNIINMGVADGVTNAIFSASASRIGLRAALNYLGNHELSEEAFREAYNAVQDIPVNALIDSNILFHGNKLPAKRVPGVPIIQGQGGSTTLSIAQYNKEKSSLKVGLIGDSDIVIFRAGESTPIIMKGTPSNEPGPYQITQTIDKRIEFDDFSSKKGMVIDQSIALKDGDVIMMCSDGVNPNAYQAIQNFLAESRVKGITDRLDQLVIEYLKSHSDSALGYDDISAMTLYHRSSLPPQSSTTARQAPAAEAPQVVLEDTIVIPSNIQEGQLIQHMNSLLEQRPQNQVRVELNPETLANYLSETFEYEGVKFKGVPQAEIVREGGKIILKAAGKFSTAAGEANLKEIKLSSESGRLVVIGKPILDLPFFANPFRGRIEGGLQKINQTLIDQTNARLDDQWTTAGFEITDNKIVLVCKRKNPLPPGQSPDSPPSGELHIPEDIDQFNEAFPIVYTKGAEFSPSATDAVKLNDRWGVRVQTFEGINQPVSALAVYDKGQDALGIEVLPNGIINIVVADGVSNAAVSLAASRIAVRASLNQLVTGIPSEQTLQTAHQKIQDSPIEKLVADRIKIMRNRPRSRPNGWNPEDIMIEKWRNFVENGDYAATTLVAGQYDQANSKFRVGIRGDSSAVIFRANGGIVPLLNPSGLGNTTWGLVYAPVSEKRDFKSYETDLYQEIDLHEDDVVMLCTDGIEERNKAYEKIQSHLMRLRASGSTDHLDQELTRFIRSNLTECIADDDVSVIALHHRTAAKQLNTI